MTMNIIDLEHRCDSQYMRVGDVEPDIADDGSLKIYNGDNHEFWKNWCMVSTQVILNEGQLTAVLCSWNCRHSLGQFWRFYWLGTRRTWKSLSEAQRLRILDARSKHAPKWAKVPGKLERDIIRGRELYRVEMDEQGAIFAYKILRQDERGFSSPLKKTFWDHGELEADVLPTRENESGIYCVKSRKSQVLSGYKGRMVKIVLSGQIVEGETGFRAQHAQIVEVL